MFVVWIDTYAVAHPDFIGLANLHVRVLIKEGNLVFQFSWLPQIVRVKECNQLSTSKRYSYIPGCRHPTIRLVHILNPGVRLNDFDGSII